MMIWLGYVIGFFIVVVLPYLWKRRVRRKRLVRAALAVINNYRTNQVSVDQMRQLAREHGVRAYTIYERQAVVMGELIAATRDVN